MIVERSTLKDKGAKWYHIKDLCAPTLTRASLGRFMYEVLKEGAQIGEIWAFNPNFDKSPVYFTLFMTEQMKENLEKKFDGKVEFTNPPKIVLS